MGRADSTQDAQKGQTSHPPNPWRLFHPPALRLPRQPLCPWTRRSADKAAASDQRCIIHLVDPSKLACFSRLEGHPCWSTCGRRTRPFSWRAFREHRANVGVIPSPHRARSASKKGTWPFPPHPLEQRREWPEKDCGLTQAPYYRGSGEKALTSFVVRLHEGLLGRYLDYPLIYTDPGGVLCAPILVPYP